MRIFFVIEETNFFQPEFLSGIVDEIKKIDKIVGAAVITKVPDSINMLKYLIANWNKLLLREIFMLCVLKIYKQAITLFRQITGGSPLYSVIRVLKRHKIPFFIVENDINSTPYLERIRNASPDLIINSGSLIFKKELLEIPKKCVINRHSSLLPSFGGILPLFHAIRMNQPLGVTAHMMVRKIDAGVILAQKEITIEDGDTLFDLYQKSYIVSIEILITAINNVRKNSFDQTKNNYKSSYYSWPTDNDWKQFRQRGIKWI